MAEIPPRIVESMENMAIADTAAKKTETADERVERVVAEAVEKARKEWMKEMEKTVAKAVAEALEKEREESRKALENEREESRKREEGLEVELQTLQTKYRVLRYEWLMQNRCALVHLRSISHAY